MIRVRNPNRLGSRAIPCGVSQCWAPLARKDKTWAIQMGLEDVSPRAELLERENSQALFTMSGNFPLSICTFQEFPLFSRPSKNFSSARNRLGSPNCRRLSLPGTTSRTLQDKPDYHLSSPTTISEPRNLTILIHSRSPWRWGGRVLFDVPASTPLSFTDWNVKMACGGVQVNLNA